MKRAAAVRLNFAGGRWLGPDMDEEGNRSAREAAQFARVALIVAMIALAIAILGLFLPIH
jgi:hypothetical protein